MRFRVGWLIPEKVVALTHFEPVVTPEDFQQITTDTDYAMQSIDENQDFHVLIDNRNITETSLISLEMMLQMMPSLNHPALRCIVVILPDQIKAQAQHLEAQQVGSIRLMYVASLNDAFNHLINVDKDIDPVQVDPSFFINERTP